MHPSSGLCPRTSTSRGTKLDDDIDRRRGASTRPRGRTILDRAKVKLPTIDKPEGEVCEPVKRRSHRLPR
jgi:hypothetical protein